MVLSQHEMLFQEFKEFSSDFLLAHSNSNSLILKTESNLISLFETLWAEMELLIDFNCLDSRSVNLKNTRGNIQRKSGKALYNVAESLPGDWQTFSDNNIRLAEQEREASIRFVVSVYRATLDYRIMVAKHEYLYCILF